MITLLWNVCHKQQTKDRISNVRDTANATDWNISKLQPFALSVSSSHVALVPMFTEDCFVHMPIERSAAELLMIQQIFLPVFQGEHYFSRLVLRCDRTELHQICGGRSHIGLSLAFLKFILDFPYVAPFGNHSASKKKSGPHFRTFTLLGEELAKCLREYSGKSSALPMHVLYSDTLLRLGTITSQKRLRSKIESKFWTFWRL